MSTRVRHIRNPRTGEMDYALHLSNEKTIRDCAEALRAASDLTLKARLDMLHSWKHALVANREEIVSALFFDTGRWTLSNLEFDGILTLLDRWCDQAPHLVQGWGATSQAFPDLRYQVEGRPYPLVGVIAPWNFPLTLSMIDAVPALCAGCAVMVKPSEMTPRFIDPLQQTIDAVPDLAARFALIKGDEVTGQTIISQVDALCFTGSIKTGRDVAERAARSFIPAFLELGGKDPAIVLDTADVDRAVTALLRGSVLNTGQACQSIERIYVARPLFDTFLERILKEIEDVSLNHPNPHEGVLGPLIDARQVDVINAQIDDALVKGAQRHCGGVVSLAGGFWCRPVVLTNVNHDMAVMRDENFGPVLPIMAFDTVEEAITLANDSHYGLSAAVFSGDEDEGKRVARALNAGAVSINDAALTALMHEAEKNSFNLSGLGPSRMGASGLLRFLRRQALITNTGPVAPLSAFEEG